MDYKQSLYRLRKTLGILGLCFPILLLFNHSALLASMSHYYYTSASIFFVSILSGFGLILMTYKGYPKKDNEVISDNLATNLAGICIFLTVLVPTRSDNSLGEVFFTGPPYLFGHQSNTFFAALHLSSAGLFLILLGFMCIYKFSLNHKAGNLRNNLFKICGYVIWASVAALIIIRIIEKIQQIDFNTVFPAYTFWIEWVAIYAFAIAWLVKGRIGNDIKKVVKYQNLRVFP